METAKPAVQQQQKPQQLEQQKLQQLKQRLQQQQLQQQLQQQKPQRQQICLAEKYFIASNDHTPWRHSDRSLTLDQQYKKTIEFPLNEPLPCIKCSIENIPRAYMEDHIMNHHNINIHKKSICPWCLNVTLNYKVPVNHPIFVNAYDHMLYCMRMRELDLEKTKLRKRIKTLEKIL